MAFDKDVPLAANQIAADLAAMNANWEFTAPGVVTTAGDIVYASAAATMARLAKSAGKVLVSGTAPSWGSLHNRNLLINGCQRHAQRGESGAAVFDATTNTKNNDDTYLLDRMLLLSDGDDIVDVTQETLGGVNSQEHYVRLDVETTGKKFAYGQIIENKNCKSIIGGVASASVELRVSDASKLSDIRVVVLSWDNGIDVLTSDWISAWEAQGVVPTPIANWTAENVATDLGVTTSFVKYKIENISIDAAGADNVAMFIYSNAVGDNDTAGIFLEIANMQLEQGAVTTDFEYLDIGHSLSLAQRYYNKSYNISTAPGEAVTEGMHAISIAAVNNSDHALYHSAGYPVSMRGVPTIVLYDSAGASGKVNMDAGAGISGTADFVGDSGFRASGTNGTTDINRTLNYHYTADVEL